MTVKERIQQLSSTYLQEILDIRRHIHAHPELSFEEFETSAFIKSKLDAWQVPYVGDFVKTGIVAEIRGNESGKLIGIRTDMDALPIQELNDISFRSTNDGRMHACGHDVHMASLLGCVRILNDMRDSFAGRIKFVFQPGEERIPGGAKLMLEENCFRGDEPEVMIAQHVYPDMEVGKVGFREGQYMASADEIFITVKGKGGHAALPERLVDPVLITSHMIVALQQVVSRNAPPAVPTVLSFGKITGEGAVNVIPDEVRLEGTFRTLNEEWRHKAHLLIEKLARGTAVAMGGDADIEIRHGYPVLVNDPAVTRQARQAAEEWLGKQNVEDLDVRMTAEDFAYFSQKYPSVLYRLGVSADPHNASALHTPRFTVDEAALKVAVELFSWIAIRFLD
ncbi:MAG TPA: M20 family metallopeptidase [Bacteroidales bacterium]|nr:M20 family metallopeptidase [Bacteroidales bacterium]